MNRTLSNVRAKLKPRNVGNPKHVELPYFFLMTDELRMPNPENFMRKMPQGAGVIFRHYGVQDRTLLAACLRATCRRLGIGFFVGGDWRLAAKVNANGLHLPARMVVGGLESGARLWLRRRNKILTVAAHSAQDLRRAKTIHANAAFLSPIFTTKSHPNQPSLGAVRCAAMSHGSKIAVIALGGISKKNITAIYPTKCAGIAGIDILSEK